jgi:hypothetical protein
MTEIIGTQGVGVKYVIIPSSGGRAGLDTNVAKRPSGGAGSCAVDQAAEDISLGRVLD